MKELNKENFKQFLERCREQEESFSEVDGQGYSYESTNAITIRELYFLAKEWFDVDLTDTIRGQSGYEV